MGRKSKDVLKVEKLKAQKAEQNRRFYDTRFHAAVNLPTEWRDIVFAVAEEEGYIYNGSVSVGGYIKALIEADLKKRGKL